MSAGGRMAALVGLAIARQAQFPVEQHGVYLELLKDISDHGLIEACRELARRPRANYETQMPSVGDIRKTVGQLDFERRQTVPQLPAHQEPDPRIIERMKRFREDVKRAIAERHAFPE